MKDWFVNNKRKAYIFVGLLFILLVLPLTLVLVKQTQDLRSKAAAPDKLETEGGVLSGTVTKLSDSQASGEQYVKFESSQTASPTNSPSPTSQPGEQIDTMRVYGPGINFSSKSDRTIPQNIARGSYRWKATQNSQMIGFRVNYRTDNSNAGYSKGTWGKYRYRLYPDDNSSNNYPNTNGIPLADLTITPSNLNIRSTGSTYMTHNWPTPPTLVAGQIYHLVIDNVDSDSTNNYLSHNQMYMTSASFSPRVPTYSDTNFAWLGANSSGQWSNDGNHTPMFDVIYANGKYDGLAYISVDGPTWRNIGGSSMVRERFTVTGSNQTINGLGATLQRVSGSSNITLRIETGSSSLIQQVTIPGSGSLPSNTYQRVEGPISTTTLISGQTYNLVISAPSGTTYRIHHILKDDSASGLNGGAHRLRSRAFREGQGQYSTNGGSSWSNASNGGWANDYTVWMTKL